MRIRELTEFLFVCKKAGFNTLADVAAYMNKYGLTVWQLFDELDAVLFPKFI